MNGIEDKHIEPSMIDTQHKSVPDSDEPKIEGKEFQTERERLFGNKYIGRQVERVLKTYKHSPAYQENFIKYLQENSSIKEILLGELEELQGNENAIQQKVIEYLAMSSQALGIYNSPIENFGGNNLYAIQQQTEAQETDTKKQEAGTKKQEADTKKREADTKLQEAKLEAVRKTIAEAKQLAQADNITPTDEQKAQAKEQLKANGIRTQLERNALLSSNPELKNGYVYLYSVQLAYQSPENANKPHRIEFNALMKNIENQLNFSDTSHNDYDTDNLTATKAHFFDKKRGNADFQKQVQNNLKNSDHTNAFEKFDQLQDTPKDFETLYELYKDKQEAVNSIAKQRGVNENDMQQLLLLVEAELNENKHDTDHQKALHTILTSIDKEYTKAAKQEVEETLLLAMVGGPMQYLGTSDASHNLKNDVKLEGKKLTTTIGTGERTQISIDYGQKNPRIFVSDFLNKQEGSYQVGLHHLKSTNISIASEEQLFEKALETVQANAETFKKSAKNLSEYQTLMSKAIYEQQMKLFEGKLGEKALATEIMKQQINKNIYSQKSIDVLQKLLNLDGGNTLLPNIFNEDTASQPILDFIQRVDVFLEYATPTQCQLRNQNLDQLMLIIQSTQDTTSVTFTSNKSELFSNVTLCTQMMKNTQYLLKNKQENQNSPTPTLNLFSVLFTHCLPSSLTPTRTEISEGIQRFSDFITYNKNGNFNNKPSLAPIITAWDKHTATPL